MMKYFHNKATADHPTSLQVPRPMQFNIFIFSNLMFCCILLIGLFGCSTVTPVVKRTVDAQPSDFVVWTQGMRSNESRNSYRIALKMPDNSITGFCILKKNGDEWRGSLLNEMSVKAFDFVVTDEKCELLNVISLMDKWYIKNTIAADLHFLFNVDNLKSPFYKRLVRFEQNGMKVVNDKKKQLLVKPDGAILLVNQRRNLQYELRRMIELDPDKVIL